jgi:hypothetical protein
MIFENQDKIDEYQDIRTNVQKSGKIGLCPDKKYADDTPTLSPPYHNQNSSKSNAIDAYKSFS